MGLLRELPSRRPAFLLACLCLCLVSSTHAAPFTIASTLLSLSSALNNITAQGALPPSQDPWYTAPSGFESAQPGQVLRVRPAPGNLLSAAGANVSAIYNLLYRTTDSRANPSWSVTTLFVPSSPAFYPNGSSSSSALLSLQLPYDSADVDASPSYALYGVGQVGQYAELVGNGWFLAIPDFEGPNASFTAGVVSGQATLDGVRAVLSMQSDFGMVTDDCDSVTTALWGYSGGALASEFAAELHATYAPELQLAGAALGGLTPNVTNVLYAINGTMAAGLAVEGILGITSQYPDARAAVISDLKVNGTHNATGFLAGLKMTLTEAEFAFAYANLSSYMVHGLEAMLSMPAVQNAITRDGYMGTHGTPQIPLFVYKAVADEISPIADTDALVALYCAQDVNILYERNSIGGHSAEGDNGEPAALEWLGAVLQGSYAQAYSTTGCSTVQVAVNISTSPL